MYKRSNTKSLGFLFNVILKVAHYCILLLKLNKKKNMSVMLTQCSYEAPWDCYIFSCTLRVILGVTSHAASNDFEVFCLLSPSFELMITLAIEESILKFCHCSNRCHNSHGLFSVNHMSSVP